MLWLYTSRQPDTTIRWHDGRVRTRVCARVRAHTFAFRTHRALVSTFAQHTYFAAKKNVNMVQNVKHETEWNDSITAWCVYLSVEVNFRIFYILIFFFFYSSSTSRCFPTRCRVIGQNVVMRFTPSMSQLPVHTRKLTKINNSFNGTLNLNWHYGARDVCVCVRTRARAYRSADSTSTLAPKKLILWWNPFAMPLRICLWRL